LNTAFLIKPCPARKPGESPQASTLKKGGGRGLCVPHHGNFPPASLTWNGQEHGGKPKKVKKYLEKKQKSRKRLKNLPLTDHRKPDRELVPNSVLNPVFTAVLGARTETAVGKKRGGRKERRQMSAPRSLKMTPTKGRPESRDLGHKAEGNLFKDEPGS